MSFIIVSSQTSWNIVVENFKWCEKLYGWPTERTFE
jgi:hypothetical protein